MTDEELEISFKRCLADAPPTQGNNVYQEAWNLFKPHLDKYVDEKINDYMVENSSGRL